MAVVVQEMAQVVELLYLVAQVVKVLVYQDTHHLKVD